MKAYQIYCRTHKMDPCLGSDTWTDKIGNPYISEEIAAKHLPKDDYSYGESTTYYIKEIEILEE